jgi:hypothetical protein
MEKQPRHRPRRRFGNAKRIIVECELDTCIHCGSPLKPRKPWHTRKTAQTMNGSVFVAGKSKECVNPACAHSGTHYYASGVWLISLPHSTYGLDVLAFIGWQHEHEHRQLVEIQRELNQRGIVINERNVGKLYRQFLALLGAMSEKTHRQLATTVAEQGGLIWAIDALQPEGHGTLLYVLYEVLSGTPVGAIQLDHPTADRLGEWLQPYQALSLPVLATLSDGEEAIIAALKACWPEAPHQRCQAHFLNNLGEPVLDFDTQLRQSLRNDLGGLPAVPDRSDHVGTLSRDEPPAGPDRSDKAEICIADGQPAAAPPFCPPPASRATLS